MWTPSLMLRPTESRILWTQQFGRGLRTAEGKDHLTVIDYIGNHRTFLLKPQTLFSLEPGDQNIAHALDQLAESKWELPPGCEVTYELEAVDILKALLRIPKEDVIRAWYEDFRDRHGERPSAVEAFHEGYTPRAVRKTYGSWLRFVDAMGDLPPDAKRLLKDSILGRFLDHLEVTAMTKSFKMVTIQAMLQAERFPGEIGHRGADRGLRPHRPALRQDTTRSRSRSRRHKGAPQVSRKEPRPLLGCRRVLQLPERPVPNEL